MPVYFGDKIRAARKAAGMTQRQLAEKINVTNTSISNWEKNTSRPDPDILQNLCWALGVQPNYFFGSDEQQKAPAESGKRLISRDEIKFALFRGREDVSDAMLDEVLTFADYVAHREEQKKKE